MAEIENVTAVMLARTSYGEADRIVRMLTKEKGKLSVMAKGARKSASKLAGGIELFSEAQCSIVKGRGELYTLASTRMLNHYGSIIKSLDTTTLGYKLLELTDKHCAEEDGADLYPILVHALECLNDAQPVDIVEVWFLARLLENEGRQIDAVYDVAGNKLQAGEVYNFDLTAMKFVATNSGRYTDAHIKLLRLVSEHSIQFLSKIRGCAVYANDLKEILQTAIQNSF